MSKDMNRPLRGFLMKMLLLKPYLLILFSLFSCSEVIAQTKFDLLTLVGTYTGHIFDAETGEQDKTSEVSVELSENFTFSFHVNINGTAHTINQRLKSTGADIDQNGTVEVYFDFVDTYSAFTEVSFSLFPASRGLEGVLLRIKDLDNKSFTFLINRLGGNPVLPGAAEGLTGQELEKELHRQFGVLFADLEKGFTARDEERAGDSSFPSAVYITHTKPGTTYRRENGVSYYYTQIKMSSGEDKWAHRDSLIQAIETYPSSDGVRVEPISYRDENKIYAVTKFREPYGYIQFKEDDDKWFFRLFIPLDPIRLKEELMSGFEMAENNFSRIQGKKREDSTYLEGWNFLANTFLEFESTRTFYGADSSLMNRTEHHSDWVSSFKYYPSDVLAYQFREMNLTFPGVTKATNKSGEALFFRRYEKPHMAFEINLMDTTVGHPKLWISRKKNSNPPVYVAPIKTYAPNAEYPAFFGQYEGDDLYSLMGRHRDDPAIEKWLTTRVYGFKKSRSGDAELYSYNAYGVWLSFSKSHLSEINLFNNKMAAFGSFNGKLPKGLQWNASAASIPSAWHQERGGRRVFYENGITTRLDFSTEEQGKLNSITIRKAIIADALEDVELNKVGVGLAFSVNNSGMVSVNNTHLGYSAKKAGIREGMWILEVDGNKVEGKHKYAVDKLLKGKLGSAVKVKYCRRYEEENAKEYLLYRGAGGRAERVIPAVSYPPFTGKYEGDDLFQLLERDFSDPAITAFIQQIFMKKIHIGTDPNRKTIQGTGIGLEFYTNTLQKISLNAYFFEGQLPQGLNFESSPAELKTSNQLQWTDEGTPSIYADYKEHIELRVDFDENSDVEGTQSTFVHLTIKPKKSSDDLVELGFYCRQGKDSDIYEVWLKESSPAYKAGIRMDDNVLRIDGTSITGMDSDDVKKIMLGKKGTAAIVVVERDGKEIECTVVR